MTIPAFAEEECAPTGPAPQDVIDAVNAGVNNFINSTNGLLPNANAIRDELKDLGTVLAGTNLDQQRLDEVSNYFASSQNKITEVKNIANTFQNNSAALTDYFVQVKEINKAFLLDMQNPANPFTTADYMKDFNLLKNDTQNFLSSLNTTVDGSKIGSKFDPRQFLDRGVSIPTQKPLEFDVIGLGLDNRFSSQNIVSMVHKFRGKFNDSKLREDLDFFLAVFPQSAEQILMEANVPPANTIFKDLGALKSQQGQFFTVDAFGIVKPKDTSNSQEFSNNTFVNSAEDQAFNSRSFGGSNGIYPQIKISANDREFVLTDRIFTSPIVLDMDGDKVLEASAGQWQPHDYTNSRVVEFDLNGDGFTEFIEWVGPNDGLLIIYREGEEVTGKNLFGDAAGFLDGYENLSAYDMNNDRILNGDEIKNFSVWQDKNSNAKVDKGEVKSLEELGITEISVTHKGLVSSFKQNGQSKTMWDWYPCVFRVKRTL
jgi:hypothetical protein